MLQQINVKLLERHMRFSLYLIGQKIKANNQDVSMVTMKIVDEKGRIIPTANNMIDLSISGNGKIIGIILKAGAKGLINASAEIKIDPEDTFHL